MKVEGEWRDVNTDQPMTRPDPTWYNRPNGAHLENCLQARVSLAASEQNFTNLWNDAPCAYSYCCLYEVLKNIVKRIFVVIKVKLNIGMFYVLT